MLKPIFMATCLAAALATGLGACATHAPSEQVAAVNDRDCVKDTGTRIKDADRKCVNAPGSSYTQQDVQQTGETNAADALRKLDPRVQ